MAKIPEQWLSSILLAIYQDAAMTREQIVQTTGLNPASVSQALQHLLRTGTIVIVGELKSRGGRRRQVLKLNPEAGYFIAVDLESARARYALTNLVGDIRYRWEQELEFGKGVAISDLLRGLKMVQRNLVPWQQSRLLAVGISCPGFIQQGGLVTAVNLGWRNFPLAEKLKQATSLPLFIHTACHVYVLAERRLGRAQGCDNCIYVEVGKGIGVGVLIDGRYLEGSDRMAGEFGHITIEPDAHDACNCGKKGCLEAIASSSSIVRQYAGLADGSPARNDHFRLSDIFENARKSDAKALAVIDRASRALAMGISHLILLFNPALIVLGGDLLLGEDLLIPRIKREMAHHLPEFTRETEITVTGLGLDIGLKGAAFLAFQNSVTDHHLMTKLCAPLAEAITV